MKRHHFVYDRAMDDFRIHRKIGIHQTEEVAAIRFREKVPLAERHATCEAICEFLDGLMQKAPADD